MTAYTPFRSTSLSGAISHCAAHASCGQWAFGRGEECDALPPLHFDHLVDEAIVPLKTAPRARRASCSIHQLADRIN